MPSKKELEHNIALLKKLLELEHSRLIAERDRANKWQADSERKSQVIELLKLSPERKQSINNDWSLIEKHFNELLQEEGLPYKQVKEAGKKRIRREANDRAAIESINVRKYSDIELSRRLQFPQNTVSRKFARQPKRK